jgi:hypothetical protein
MVLTIALLVSVTWKGSLILVRRPQTRNLLGEMTL